MHDRSVEEKFKEAHVHRLQRAKSDRTLVLGALEHARYAVLRGFRIPLLTDHSRQKTQPEDSERERGIDDCDSRVEQRPIVLHVLEEWINYVVSLGLFELECRRCRRARLPREGLRAVANGLSRVTGHTKNSSCLLSRRCTSRRMRVDDYEGHASV